MQVAQASGKSGVNQLTEEVSRVVDELGERINQRGFGLPMVGVTL